MTDHVQAAVLRAPEQRLEIEELTLDVLQPNEVVVRMTASDLCGRDTAIIHGSPQHALPVVLGHEGVGVVDKVGSDVTRVRPGDTVLLKNLPGAGCGSCHFCTRKQSLFCERPTPLREPGPFRDRRGDRVGAFLDLGTLAEALITGEHALVPVRTDLAAAELSLLGCPVRSGCWAVFNTARVEAGDTVAIYGAGAIGMSMTQAARISGAHQIVVIEPVPVKRALALELGATSAIDPAVEDPVDFIREATGGRGADHVFEAVGTGETMKRALDSTRRGGATVLTGIAAPSDLISLHANEMSMGGRRILASHSGPYDMQFELERYVRLAEAGLLDLRRMVSRTVPLHDVNDVIDDLADADIVRSVVVF